MTQSRISTAWAAAMTTLASVGVGLALYLVNVKLRLEFDPTFQSSCNLGSKLNCDLVQTSAQSTVAGYPLALWGAVAYVTAIALAWFAARSTRHGRHVVAALAAGGVVVCLHSAYLAYVSSALIGAYCLFCIAMYGVNLGLTALAFAQWRKVRGDDALVATALNPVAAAAILVALGIAVALALPAYTSVRAGRAAARISAARAEAAAMNAAPTAALPPKDATIAGSSATATGVTAAAATTAAAERPTAPATGPGADTRLTIRTHPQGFRYSTEVMRKGRSYFEVPVSAADFPLGPANAPVTIVEFADFECGYCRALTANFKPLKKKYAGRVRWVFKHFPLDNRCNKVMKGTQHPDACIAAKAANCAGLQGKFWPMHDRIYDRTLRINAPNLREWAEAVGVDLVKYDACFADDAIGHAKTRADSISGRFARISGTPRTYINGHLVPGVNATEVLDYYIKAALKSAAKQKVKAHNSEQLARHGATQPHSTARRHNMVQQHTTHSTYWIDAYEASVDAQGRALSLPGVRPAEASWFEARVACAKAGKRLCSEEEWISACTGEAAVDNDGDKDFSDDAVEGALFPYGLFHEGGRCNDNQRGDGQAVATGSLPGCQSPAGVFDQSGNLAEWTGTTEPAGMLSGTDFRWGPKATCMKRNDRFGLGYRNATTGFRCCADQAVAAILPGGASSGASGAPTAIAHHGFGAEGGIVPHFSVQDADGQRLTHKQLLGHVTIVSFFASWCGPCRRELPELNVFYGAHKAAGLRVLAIGVDKRPAQAKTFVVGLKLKFSVAYDPKAVAMGAFGVKGMPTMFLVGRDGRILRRLVGINATKVAAFQSAAVAALSAAR